MDKSYLDISWLLLCAILVLLMQVGFLCLESGLTRSKNAINVAIKNLSAVWITILLFWAFGFSFMFGNSWHGWIGSGYFTVALDQGGMWLPTFFLYQVLFCAAAVTIISGAVAERVRFSAYLLIAILVAVWLYPVFGHWSWGGGYQVDLTQPPKLGWLAQLGFVDMAGATVVHSTGGWVALAAVLVIGPRLGRFPADSPAQTIPANNMPLAIAGVLLLSLGWLGFNGGALLSLNERVPLIIVNTLLSATGGFTTGLLLGWRIKQHPDVGYAMNGLLAGLVAITASAHVVTTSQAVVIGSIGGTVMLAVTKILEHQHIDDVVGAIPVHLGAGIWGTLAVALFGDSHLLATGLDQQAQLQMQLMGIALCALWSFGSAYLLLTWVNRFWPLRVSAEEEHIGLNISEHRVKNELGELLYAMAAQTNSRDLSQRVPVEPFTEIGQIAQRYNQVIESLQQAVSHSEHIIRDIKDGIITFNHAGIITSFNPAAERIFRCPAEIVIGQDFASLLFPVDTQQQKLWQPSNINLCLDKTHETKGLRYNTEPFTMELTVSRGHIDGQIMYSCLIQDTTERKQAEDAKRLQELSQKISESQENERRRLSRELHDGINQLLVSVKYKLEAAEYEIEQQNVPIPIGITKASAELDNIIKEVRHISHDLRSSVLDILGLFPALDNLSREFSQRTGIVVNASTAQPRQHLPEEVQTALYRIAQEAFTNIEKHSRADTVSFSNTCSAKYLTMRIQDNGSGFDVDKVFNNCTKIRGIGLQNMQERLKFLGCWLRVHSVPGQGALILVKVPLTGLELNSAA